MDIIPSLEQGGIRRLDQAKASSYFGCNTFNDRVMKEKLPKDQYKVLRQIQKRGGPLPPDLAKVVAHAMKEWALERGATHFTHWFLPMTGATAEKHDAFIVVDEAGGVIERFSEAQLVQGEPDASSFPSGGLRATFEARGYTAWDPTSPAFLMEGPLGITLCIPTCFVGYHGEALDHKVPLLRSMEWVSRRSCEALARIGMNANTVVAQCGAEQEYFLVDLEQMRKRPDLLFANRTLQGARPPKGQELEDHYFGSIKGRVLGFMQEVELECFKLAIPAKTRHNEVAPNQFEIAPIYEPANIASDHNQMLMELLKSVGERRGLAVLLHEKPFAGVNGSGKHVNWSLATDGGHNLLDPGHTPEENIQFLYFLCAVLKGIHKHGDLFRAAIASAGNDHRLGANEAPPAIMSVFLGEQLSRILDALEKGDAAAGSEKHIIDLGLAQLPTLAKDATDRNRTSPFAFTGNKFEFRAVGSSQPIAFPLTILNAAMAEALETMNAELDGMLAAGMESRLAVLALIRKGITETRSVRFEGNGYANEWKQEAARRGLPHAKDTVEALASLESESTRQLLVKGGVFTSGELEARIHIRHEQYQKTLAVEAQVLREMAETMLLPAALRDLGERAQALAGLSAVGVGIPEGLKAALNVQVNLAGVAQQRILALKAAVLDADGHENMKARTAAFGNKVRTEQEALRDVLDQLEKNCNAKLWPLPPYREMMAPLV